MRASTRHFRNPDYKVIDAGYKTPCWIWQKYFTSGGYGLDRTRGAPSSLAHRCYYIKYKGSIPDGMVIDHLCKNTLCVNPDHLEAVTQKINIRRGNTGKGFRGMTCETGMLLRPVK